jgi:hypothetical protein
MKLTIKLEAQDCKQAIAEYVTKIIGIPVHAKHVTSGDYSWDTPSVTYDTDQQQKLASIAAEQ